jgi:hypothetical protein
VEHLTCKLDPEAFDAAVHGRPGEVVLPEGGDLAFVFKPNATEGGNPGLVVTFTVQLPDGTTARAQAVTTLANFELAAGIVRGWRARGDL